MDPIQHTDPSSEEAKVARRNPLFAKYIEPNLGMVRHYAAKYSQWSHEIDDNYSHALLCLWKGIETYNPEMSLKTWIHIVVKRAMFELNHQQNTYFKRKIGYSIWQSSRENGLAPAVEYSELEMENYESLFSDEVMDAINALSDFEKQILFWRANGESVLDTYDLACDAKIIDLAEKVRVIRYRFETAKKTMKQHVTREQLLQDREANG